MLTSLEYVKLVLGISTSSQDAQLSALLEAADAAVKRFTGFYIERRTNTEFYSGQNTKFIVLRQVPVYSITSVYLDDAGYYGQGTGFGSETLLTAGTDYDLRLDSDETFSESGTLIRIGTIWPMVNQVTAYGKLTAELGPNLGNIKVTYVSGHTTVASNIQLATAMLVARYLTTAPGGGQSFTEEELGRWRYRLSDHMVTSNGMSLPTDIAELLKYEREMVF